MAPGKKSTPQVTLYRCQYCLLTSRPVQNIVGLSHCVDGMNKIS